VGQRAGRQHGIACVRTIWRRVVAAHPRIEHLEGAALELRQAGQPRSHQLDYRIDSRDVAYVAVCKAHVAPRRMCADGVLMSTDGPDRTVLKIKPPLAFGADDVEALVRALDRALAAPAQ
jgi:acetylornithine/succinyldiaminopimelate/putrescine aminotransferase